MKVTNCEGNWLVIPDTHVRKKAGGEDKRSIDLMLNYAAKYGPWKGVIHLGDLMDHNTVNSHEAGNIRATAGETLLEDYEVGGRLLDTVKRTTGAQHYYLIEGNHDYRPERMIDQYPQLAGLGLETKIGLDLARRNWEWVPFWTSGSLLHVGKASFGHGRYTGDHHAKQHAVRHGRNFYYGHLHDFQAHTMEREGDDDKYEAASLGCLCEYRQYYLKGRPTRWQQGFSVFRFQKDGHFNRYEVRIFKHKFICPEGEVFKG